MNRLSLLGFLGLLGLLGWATKNPGLASLVSLAFLLGAGL